MELQLEHLMAIDHSKERVSHAAICDLTDIFILLIILSVAYGDFPTWWFVGWPKLWFPLFKLAPFPDAVGVQVFR